MGTSELYSAIEALLLRPGVALNGQVTAKLNNAIKTALSPRFVPNEIFAVAEIPRTLSGKKKELPIKKLLRSPADWQGGES